MFQSKLLLLSAVHERAPRPFDICILPGGPGLSIATCQELLGLDARSIWTLEPPGVGSNETAAAISYEQLVRESLALLRGIERPLMLIGHSFGGMLATELAAGLASVRGLVLLAAPMSAATYKGAIDAYARYMTPALREAEGAWISHPSNSSFRAWLSNYGRLYFLPGREHEGARLLLEDRCSATAFSGIRFSHLDASGKDRFIELLRSLRVPKLFVAGSEDVLVSSENLKRDAEATDSNFKVVSEAAHFVSFDQPAAVRAVVESFFDSLEVI